MWRVRMETRRVHSIQKNTSTRTCLFELTNRGFLICSSHFWLVLVLEPCPSSRWSLPLFFGVTSRTWPSIAYRETNSTREYYCCSLLRVDDTSKNESDDDQRQYFTFILTFCYWNRVLESNHASYVRTVPYKYTASFTLFQFVYFLLCFGVTWIPIAGILFPVPFFILMAIRQYLLPKIFSPHHLYELDAAEYEEVIGTPRHTTSFSLQVRKIRNQLRVFGDNDLFRFFFIHLSVQDNATSPGGSDEAQKQSIEDRGAEILEEFTTNRGELKLRTKNRNNEDKSTPVRICLPSTDWLIDRNIGWWWLISVIAGSSRSRSRKVMKSNLGLKRKIECYCRLYTKKKVDQCWIFEELWMDLSWFLHTVLCCFLKLWMRVV